MGGGGIQAKLVKSQLACGGSFYNVLLEDLSVHGRLLLTGVSIALSHKSIVMA